ncbi:MAG: ATP-binding cassette domain-containing protein [Pseudomonadota bacterium]
MARDLIVIIADDGNVLGGLEAHSFRAAGAVVDRASFGYLNFARGEEMAELLSMSGIEKAFAGLSALSGASLEIAPGELHALIGQNGAGKSTLIKTLTGVYRRDDGVIRFDGAESVLTSPREAQAAGIATIYQELNLVPLRSVTENVMMGYRIQRSASRR